MHPRSNRSQGRASSDALPGRRTVTLDQVPVVAPEDRSLLPRSARRLVEEFTEPPHFPLVVDGAGHLCADGRSPPVARSRVPGQVGESRVPRRFETLGDRDIFLRRLGIGETPIEREQVGHRPKHDDGHEHADRRGDRHALARRHVRVGGHVQFSPSNVSARRADRHGHPRMSRTACSTGDGASSSSSPGPSGRAPSPAVPHSPPSTTKESPRIVFQ